MAATEPTALRRAAWAHDLAPARRAPTDTATVTLVENLPGDVAGKDQR